MERCEAADWTETFNMQGTYVSTKRYVVVIFLIRANKGTVPIMVKTNCSSGQVECLHIPVRVHAKFKHQ